MAKIVVDKNLCIGCGACTGIASETFTIGDDGLAEVINNKITDEAKTAVECCPVGAIKTEE